MNVVIVTGSQGRIGRLVRFRAVEEPSLGLAPIWLTRAEWDLRGPPGTELHEGAVLMNLAGVVRGRGDLDENVRQAKAIVAADARCRFRHVLHLSSAAVLPPGPKPLGEEVPSDPPTEYGRAKAEAEKALLSGLPGRVTVLRLANIAGADALLGGNDPAAEVLLDPVPGQKRGPVRSWIGPGTLGRVLMALAARPEVLPPILNLAQPGVVAMADLLDAAARRWRFGPDREGVIARVELSTTRLESICRQIGCPLPRVSAKALVSEVNSLKGRWP